MNLHLLVSPSNNPFTTIIFMAFKKFLHDYFKFNSCSSSYLTGWLRNTQLESEGRI